MTIFYDLDIVFKTSTGYLSTYGTFITMTNAPVTSFSGSSNVVTKVLEHLMNKTTVLKYNFCEVGHYELQ